MSWTANPVSVVPNLAHIARRNDVTLCAFVSVLAIVHNLQLQRVFVPTMIFVVDQSNRTELVANAAVVFVATVLVGAICRFATVRLAALISVTLVAASRVITQFSSDPEVRWMVAATGVIASGWLIVLLALANRNALALAIPVAFWLDIALRTLFDTIDLAYMTTNVKDIVAIVLVIAAVVLVAAMRWPAEAIEQSWTASISLMGFGPGMASFALVSGNLGLAAVLSGNDLPFNFWLLSIAPILALAVWSAAPNRLLRSVPKPLQVVLVGVIGAIGLAGIWTSVEQALLAEVSLVVFGLASMILTMVAVAGSSLPRRQTGAWRTATMLTIGMCIHAATVFLYFASSGSFLYLGIAYLVLAAAAFSASRNRQKCLADRVAIPASRPLLIAITVAMALVMVSAGRDDRFAIDLGEEITVVTYNIQNGFSRDNVWDLEATARTIENLEPDIVLLQESGRGWFALGWADQVWWLSNRLEMDFAFGPASNDGLWGNAILSAAPLLNPEVVKYSSTENLNRSVVSVEVPVPTGTLWVASTHLDNPSGAGEVRLAQMSQLLEEWGGTEPAVIGGDFNAQPDSDVVAAMTDAGFFDSAAVAGDPRPTSENGNRIDYVFVTPDIGVVDVEAPEVWTSDHRPVRVELSLVLE